MEEIQLLNDFKLICSENIPYYVLGFLAFFSTILDDWLNKKRKFRKFAWYLQEFIYTTLSIILGICGSVAFEVSPATSLIISILMGLVGSTIIRKIRKEKDTIATNVVEGIKDKANLKKKEDNN